MKVHWFVLLTAVVFGILIGNIITAIIENIIVPEKEHVKYDCERDLLETRTSAERELIAAIHGLRESIVTVGGVGGLPVLNHEGQEREPERVAVSPVLAPDLQSAIEALPEALKNSSTAGTGRPPIVQENEVIPELVAWPPEYSSEKQAENDLLCLSYRQVLRRFGRPTISSPGTGGVHWGYEHPEFQCKLWLTFVDGYVMSVSFEKW